MRRLAVLTVALVGSFVFALAVPAQDLSQYSGTQQIALARGKTHFHLLRVRLGSSHKVVVDPAGLSIEYQLLAKDMGTGTCPPPALVKMLESWGSPPLRLGGISADFTVPTGVEAQGMKALPPLFWQQLHCLVVQSEESVNVSLNAHAPTNLGWAEAMVVSARAAVPHGLSFSIGNEPDLYQGPGQGERRSSWRTFLRRADSLRPAVGSSPLVGPELAMAGEWHSSLAHVLRDLPFREVGVHLYPLGGRTVPGLLSEASANVPRSLRWVVRTAHGMHRDAIISEGNSADHFGVEGVSNQPAAGVWGVRYVLSALATGFREVRFHSAAGPYDSFTAAGEQMTIHPLGEAIRVLNSQLPPGLSWRQLLGLRGLRGIAIRHARKTTYLIDNPGHRQHVLNLAGTGVVHLEELNSEAPGARHASLTLQGRLAVPIPPESIVILSP